MRKMSLPGCEALRSKRRGSVADSAATQGGVGFHETYASKSLSDLPKTVRFWPWVTFQRLESDWSLPEWPECDEVALARNRVLLGTMEFSPLEFTSDELCWLALDIFKKVGLPAQMTEEQVVRFILAVRLHMHDNTYHNWHHVCDVLNTTFAFSVKTRLLEKLNPLEKFALLCAALCHDIDHPGATSSFVANAGHLFESDFRNAILEKHHALRTFEVMVNSDVGLLTGLSTVEYYAFRATVSTCIWGTDFGSHAAFLARLSAHLEACDCASSAGEEAPAIDRSLELVLLLKVYPKPCT